MTNTPAVYTPQQLRHLSRIVKAEREVAAATVKALQLLGQAVRDQLTNDGYTATVLDSRAPVWREQLAEQIMPTIARVYDQGFRSQTRATTAAIMPSGEAVPGDFGMADHLATQYLQTVHNRMVGVADDVFAVIAATLEEGRQATYTLDDGTSVVGDSIPQLAARVQAVLADNTRWSGDATRVARTEVIGANNAGQHAAAYNNAELFGTSSTQVIKEWLDTADERTRESHRIGGQKVLGLDTPFSVGGASLQQPGDPSGPAGEVINCVVGSTQVAWPGQLVHATTRREYSGTFVHIVTARGHNLTVTPNHPVLTEDGYVPAESLRVGQNVIATLRPPAPEVEDGPPSIEQVHAAAQQVGTTRGVRGSRVDFHGDGTEAEVEVVRPDRNLLLEGDVERIREGLQQVLVRLSDGARGLARSRRAKRRANTARIGDQERANSRAAGLVGSRSAGTALLWGHAGGRGKVGLAARPDRQTQTLEAAYDQTATDAEVTRHLEDTLALGMTPCQIIEVDVYEGTHEVFNLQTSDAWYVGNGIAQHNCRCTALYHYPGDPGYDEMATELGALPGVTAAASPQEDDPMTTTPPEAPEVDESDGDEPNSVVVVALPAASDPVTGIGDEQKHATILFLGDVDENDGLTDDFRTALYALVAASAAAGAPTTENVTGVQSLGDDDARVWMLDAPDLTKLHDDWLKDPAVQAAWQGVEQYPTYTPHVTIGYPPDTDEAPEGAPEAPETPDTEEVLDAETEQAAAAIQSITFDRLAVWWAGEQTEWPLGAPADAAPANAPAAAALRLAGATWAEAAEQSGHPSALAARQAVRALFAAADDAPAPLVEPMPQPTDGPALAQDIPADGDPFHGILAPEGVVSGDNRMFAPESLIARDLPLPLMYQDATEDGHDGAVRVGRIDTIWRDTDRYAKPMIRYAGVWDTSDTALEAKRQVEAKVLRGISVDGDQVTTRLVGSDGTELDPMNDDVPADGVIIEECLEARADGGTLCSVPAFQQAYIANGVYDDTAPEPGQDEVAGVVKPLPTSPNGDTTPPVAPQEPQVASGAPGTCSPAWTLGLVAAATEQGSWVLPAAHFADPHLEGPTAMTVGEDGHVYGHLALWGTCHMGVAGKCMEPPVSASNYSFFSTGTVHTDDGGTVNVGQLTIGTGHANLRYNARATVDHYDNTGTAVADVVMGHDTHGIWFSGHLRPEATPDQVYAMTAAGSVSGDWREVIRGSGQLELVAALVVNVPGYPIGRPALTASAHGPTALVASGMVLPTTMAARVGPGIGSSVVFSDEAVADLTRRIMAGIAREQRLAAARTRVRTHHAAALVARLNERTI